MKNLHVKKLIRSISERQPVLLIGNWDEGIKENILKNQNSIYQIENYSDLANVESNSCTRLVCKYNEQFFSGDEIFKQFRDKLLPTGKLIITAFHEKTFFQKIFKSKINFPKDITPIKPKLLQDKIHDNGFLIEGYYGYTENHLIMIAEIQNKEVSTLFNSKDQSTIKNIPSINPTS